MPPVNMYECMPAFLTCHVSKFIKTCLLSLQTISVHARVLPFSSLPNCIHVCLPFQNTSLHVFAYKLTSPSLWLLAYLLTCRLGCLLIFYLPTCIFCLHACTFIPPLFLGDILPIPHTSHAVFAFLKIYLSAYVLKCFCFFYLVRLEYQRPRTNTTLMEKACWISSNFVLDGNFSCSMTLPSIPFYLHAPMASIIKPSKVHLSSATYPPPT